jgi:hypothetical protein
MTTGSGDMPRITPNPSIWIPAKGRFCARVAILVLLGTLLLVGSAHAAASGAEPAGEASSSTAAESAPEASSATPPAAEPGAETSYSAEPVVASSPEASSPSPVIQPAGETSAPASGAEPGGEASSSTAAESAPEASSATPPAAEPGAETSSPAEPVVDPAPEASPAPEVSSPVPVADPAPEASLPAELVGEPAPKASPPLEPSKEAPAAELTKEAKEAPAGKTVLEQSAESLSPSLSAAQSAATADNPSDSVAAEVLDAVAGPATTISPFIPEELQTTSAASSADAAALARTIAAQRAEDFTRELGGLGASSTDIYTAGFDSPSLISAAFVGDLAMGTAARAGAPAGGRSGGPPDGSSPIGPPPGSTPSGTFGGAAAGGGSGTALSGFPTFAGHLLLRAPLAMRRLRLSFQPWLTAFFVLIPERPG